jgi:uncharacterized glyoxalase superfamily protein PhnB
MALFYRTKRFDDGIPSPQNGKMPDEAPAQRRSLSASSHGTGRARLRPDSSATRYQSTAMKMIRLVPMLPVKSMPGSVEFYEKLGFRVERREDHWGWAMLRFDDCRIMVDQSINRDPDAPRPSVVYLYPEDVVGYHAQLRATGLAIPDLDTTFYGMKEFRIDDPDGNRLWIGQVEQRPATKETS